MYNFSGMLFLGSCLVLAAFIVVSVRVFQVNPALIKKIFRYLLIFVFFLFFAVSAVIIGFRISDRHAASYSRSLKSVQQIWGGAAMQASPVFSYESVEVREHENAKTGQMEQRRVVVWKPTGFKSQNLELTLERSERKKGLLLFAGYNLSFKAIYVVENRQKIRMNMRFHFPLPQSVGNLTEVVVLLNNKPYNDDASLADGIDWQGFLAVGEQLQFTISYRAQGSDSFRYQLSANKIEIEELNAGAHIGYQRVSIPDHAMVPATKNEADGKNHFHYKATQLITDQDIAVY